MNIPYLRLPLRGRSLRARKPRIRLPFRIFEVKLKGLRSGQMPRKHRVNVYDTYQYLVQMMKIWFGVLWHNELELALKKISSAIL